MNGGLLMEKRIEKGVDAMSAAIMAAIDSENLSLKRINEYLTKQMEYLKRIEQLPDDNEEKIKAKKEAHERLVRIGIIDENNKLTEAYRIER
jgi:hypothetical protein